MVGESGCGPMCLWYSYGAVLLLTFIPLAAAEAQGVVAVGEVVGDDDNEDATTSASCRNLGEDCEQLASDGQCELNPTFMELACQSSCGTCIPESRVSGCFDRHRDCEGWGERGECDRNPAFMNINCPSTCTTCPPAVPEDCVDQHQYCFLGSLLGLCRTNPSFYLVFCSASCRRFITVCSQDRSSIVRDLCLKRAQGEEIECGIDPTTASVRRRRNTHHNTSQVELLHQDLLSDTRIESQSPLGLVKQSKSPMNMTEIGEIQSQSAQGLKMRSKSSTYTMENTIIKSRATQPHLKLTGDTDINSKSIQLHQGQNKVLRKLPTKMHSEQLLLSVWHLMVEGIKRNVKWNFEPDGAKNISENMFRSFMHPRQVEPIFCCLNGSLPLFVNKRSIRKRREQTANMENFVTKMFKQEESSEIERSQANWQKYARINGEKDRDIKTKISLLKGNEGTLKQSDSVWMNRDDVVSGLNKTQRRNETITEKEDNEEYKHNTCSTDQGCSNSDDVPDYPQHQHKLLRQVRQILPILPGLLGYPPSSEVIELCQATLPFTSQNVNICLASIYVIPLIAVLALHIVLLTQPLPPQPRLPPPPTFTSFPRFNPTPPSNQATQPTNLSTTDASTSSTPSTSTASTSTTPSTSTTSTSTTPFTSTPSTASTDSQISAEARVRALVPFCTGSGFLSLVERLRRLVAGNTGRPLSPLAASLAGAVNYCKFGVGSSAATVGAVPEAPGQFGAPEIGTIALGDQEAKMSLKAPQRWPGVSLPALHVFLQGSRPPPPTHTPTITGVSPGGYIPPGVVITPGRVAVGNGTDVDEGGIDIDEGGIDVDEDGIDVDEDGIDIDEINAGPDAGDGTEDATVDTDEGPEPVTEANLRSRLSFSCGGALISPYHVLTAAHCLLDPGLTDGPTPKFQKPTVVRLGELDFERVDESQAFDYQVADIQVHEDYALPVKYNDIAIITLKDKVEFTSALRPYCLPERVVDLVGRRCTVSGWGRRPGGQVSTILHNVEVEVVSNEECVSAYLNDSATQPFFQVDYPEGVTGNMLCAGKTNDVCRGDSGGPLILEEGGVEEEVGVVSTGYGCGSVQYPGIYTRVDHYTQWINEQIYGGC